MTVFPSPTLGSNRSAAITGLHVIADLYGCKATETMVDGDGLEAACSALVREVGLLDVGRQFHVFPGGCGVTGTVILAESHLCLHTWPEHGYVSLDVFVCNYSADNTAKARTLANRLIALFCPTETNLRELSR